MERREVRARVRACGRVEERVAPMDATRSDACPTGMIMEVVNTGSQGAQLEPKSMPRHLHELINVPGDGNCLYHCLAELYKFTVRWPIGAQLRNRMQSVTAQYSPGRTFAPTAPFLRMLFLDFLRTHWDHYYSNEAFRDSLLHVAKKDMFSLKNELEPTSTAVKRAYIERMGRVWKSGRVEWGGAVECDIASEMFGMRITLWVDLANEPRHYWLNNVFYPQLLAGSVDPDVAMWEWNLVQTGMSHFQFLKPWVAGPHRAAEQVRTIKEVRWAAQVEEVQPGAMQKIRKLVSSRLPYTWRQFSAWFDQNFSVVGVTARLAALHLCYAAYLYFVSTADEEQGVQGNDHIDQIKWWARELQAPPYIGSSVVEEVFTKHARFAP